MPRLFANGTTTSGAPQSGFCSFHSTGSFRGMTKSEGHRSVLLLGYLQPGKLVGAPSSSRGRLLRFRGRRSVFPASAAETQCACVSPKIDVAPSSVLRLHSRFICSRCWLPQILQPFLEPVSHELSSSNSPLVAAELPLPLTPFILASGARWEIPV